MFGFGKSGKASLDLNRDQALVLFELLGRWIDDAPRPTPTAECFENAAELVVLKQLDEKLKEAFLSEALRPDYLDLLAAARERLAEEFTVGDTLQD